MWTSLAFILQGMGSSNLWLALQTLPEELTSASGAQPGEMVPTWNTLVPIL